MDRVRALLGGAVVAVLIFDGIVAVRVVTRLFWAATRFVETVGLLLFAVVVGYLAYRVFLGDSDDPRRR